METTAVTMFNSTVKYSGDDIFIQPFCDFFGISYKNQLRSILRNPLLKKAGTKKRSISLFGDNFERVALKKQAFITWILQINPQIVHENLREKLFQYQSLIFDFMFGSVQREEKARLNYARLNKLKRLKGIISSEISKCESDIHNYLENKFVQTKLEFTPIGVNSNNVQTHIEE
jgi:P22_AR N-terminal domain